MTLRQWPARAGVILLILLGMNARAEPDDVEARLRKDIFFLASDKCEGRGVTTKGINLAADYIASEFKKAGLEPCGTESSYFQPFTMAGSAKLDSPNLLSFLGPQGQTIELKLGEQFQPIGMSGSGKVKAPVVFVGYGATATNITYDDYKDIDTEGKVVIVLRKTPRADNTQAPFDGEQSAHHSGLISKLVNADLHKAAAVLFANDRDSAKDSDHLMDFTYTADAASPGKLPAVHVHRDLVNMLLQSGTDKNLQSIEEDIDRDLKPLSAPIAGWTASLEVTVQRPVIHVKNVVGTIEGSGPLANETIVVGAHYDHLGYGGFNSLARDLKTPAIHYGADDNASGTTSLIELARRFAKAPKRDGRRLVLMAFSGEESGLLGSEHYCKHPIYPLENTVAMINMDMVGRMVQDNDDHKDKLIVYGTGTAKTFAELIDSLNKRYSFHLKKVPGGFGPSDHASFYAKKIPVFFLFTGDHADYHRPSDTADKINIEGMKRVTDFVQDLTNDLVVAPQRPEYVKVDDNSSHRPSVNGPRIGIRPSYGDTDEGVLLGGVSEGGPAAKAGLQEGDRIVEIGGKPVKDLDTYMVLMARHKKGEAVELGILRNGQKLTVQVTPE